MNEIVIDAKNISVTLNRQSVLENISWQIEKGQHWLITGPSGSGKTALAHVITGALFHQGELILHGNPRVEMIAQQHRFKTLSNTTDFYYQQRFNSTDSEDSLTIKDVLEEYLCTDEATTLHLLRLVHLDEQLEEPVIQLSNGENKRLQLVKALLKKPSVLLLDSPFTGLDTDGRTLLHKVIENITEKGITVLLFGGTTEIPRCINRVLELESGRIHFIGPIEEFQRVKNNHTHQVFKAPARSTQNWPAFKTAVKMVNVTVRYDQRIILEDINWEVSKGECWLVSGPNGAGKSTLLSLITADNPQAYANELYLFDKRRGRGESIWDIKRHTGLVSPELHLFFPDQSTCFEVIASGLFDTIGLFRQISEEQESLVTDWITGLGLEKFSDKPLRLLSLGQQRLCLLARALVKNPPLLVLDEPCQGLDPDQTQAFNQLVDSICRQYGATLIYVSHYQEDLPACLQYHLQLKNGRAIPGAK